MELESLSETVKKALDYYDNKTMKYQWLINNQDVKFDEIDNTIRFFNEDKEEIYNYELLGYYDNSNSIWIWSWVLFQDGKDTQQSRYLLEYGLKLEPKNATQEQMMIKGILVNSRILIQEGVQLDVNLAIYTYLVKDRIKFIYPRKRYLDKTNTKYVTFYYLIK